MSIIERLKSLAKFWREQAATVESKFASINPGQAKIASEQAITHAEELEAVVKEFENAG